jgi:hypothetical protein
VGILSYKYALFKERHIQKKEAKKILFSFFSKGKYLYPLPSER